MEIANIGGSFEMYNPTSNATKITKAADAVLFAAIIIICIVTVQILFKRMRKIVEKLLKLYIHPN